MNRKEKNPKICKVYYDSIYASLTDVYVAPDNFTPEKKENYYCIEPYEGEKESCPIIDDKLTCFRAEVGFEWWDEYQYILVGDEHQSPLREPYLKKAGKNSKVVNDLNPDEEEGFTSYIVTEWHHMKLTSKGVKDLRLNKYISFNILPRE